MQVTHVHGRHRRGSSPVPNEIHRGFLEWINRLRSIEQFGLVEIVDSRGRTKREMDSLQLEAEARWQDDGGEGGSIE
ncbi:MAG: hypothetical protein L0Y80_04805 [Ignavibacteriae bacterium]|nr:hypothetical protein [Ignavibacteriota bacterium]